MATNQARKSTTVSLPPIPIPQDAPVSTKVAFQQVVLALKVAHSTATTALAVANTPGSGASSSDVTELQAQINNLAMKIAALSGTIPSLTIESNIANSPAAAIPNSLSAILDAVFGAVQGAILYRGATGWAELAPSTNGDVLTTQGAGANPIWAAPTSGATRTFPFFMG